MRLRLTAICRTGRASVVTHGERIRLRYSHPIAAIAAAGMFALSWAVGIWLGTESGLPFDASNIGFTVLIGSSASGLIWLVLRQRDWAEIDLAMGTAELRKYSGILSETTSIDTRRLSVAIRPIAVHQPRWPTWNGYALVLCEGERPVMALSIRRTLAECRKDCSAFPDALMKGLTERSATIHAASAY